MCGIVGVFSFKDNVETQRSFIDWSLQTMHHRGPDSNGTWSNQENYIAGFVRLSIRDLSDNGNQPMLSSCGRYAVSFNGEIYNTKGFRSRLEDDGINFKSNTDTEVLLYALIRWGEKYVLDQFDGIFAFAFYNQLENKLILARDRSGIKPLYIGHSSKGIVYSSQYDHIINHSYIQDNALNEGAIGAYMCLGYVPENSGAVCSTFMLPHGYYVTVTSKGFSTERFFNYSLNQTSSSTSSLEEVLERNVKAQLVSDVPVGTFMSGGVDSPLVSFFANKHTRLQSFTIGVNDERIDESKAAAEYAAIFNTVHHSKHITEKDLLENITDNTRAFTEPFADFSSIPTLVLSKYTKEKVTVALSGDGGDELFWGYPRNMRMLQEGILFKHNKLVRLLNFSKEKLSGGKRVTKKRHLEVNDFPAYYYRSLFINGAEYWLPDLFNEKIEEAFFLQQLYHEKGILQVSKNHLMNVLRKLEFDIHLQRILLKVDRSGMYHSLEIRVPLLSNEMINYSTSLAYNNCVENGEGKFNLKKLLADKTNEKIVFQPKKGFVIPIGDWLRKELKTDVEDKIMNMTSELRVLFNQKELAKIYNQHMTERYDWGWFIWSLYSLVNWHTEHRNVKSAQCISA